jgi:hypothetical protein
VHVWLLWASVSLYRAYCRIESLLRRSSTNRIDSGVAPVEGVPVAAVAGVVEDQDNGLPLSAPHLGRASTPGRRNARRQLIGVRAV